ncbi:MAG: SLBB domain-containing protein [Ignavibacteriales bacterium]|nr:SLBB domain-containing protein [Ignavibacteriales bacterium]
MRFTKLLFFLLVISTTFIVKAQDVKVGRDVTPYQAGGAFYDYSDPDKLNIPVSVLGYVKFPGKYMVPDGTNVLDLLSFAGGPTTDALLEQIALFRYASSDTTAFPAPQNAKDSSLISKTGNRVLELNYNSLLWDDYVTPIDTIPTLQPGDILLLKGEPRFFFRDYLSIGLQILSAAISLVILILNITRN